MPDTSEKHNTTEKENKTSEQKEAPVPAPVVTKHSVKLGNRRLAYTATAGYMKMTDEEGKHKANIFYVAYTLDGGDAKQRPLTFAFNGGPGSSSAWLHLGALGPKRVLLQDDGAQHPPPATIVPNDYTWLEFTDLVFIDPVGTGYSRAAKDEKSEQFLGLEEDLKSVAEFIRRYTTAQKRWLSPKFLAGESYGTTRAAGLSSILHDQGMVLNGIILISVVLQFQTLHLTPGNDLPSILFLPAFTATAWYHKKLSRRLQSNLTKTLAEVRNWAMSDYTLALMRGDGLSQKEKDAVAEKLSEYTGLSKEYILLNNNRVHIFRFCKELLRNERRTVGRLDSRFTGRDSDAGGSEFEYDPSYDIVIYGPFTAAVNDHLRSELNYENDLHYEVLSGVTHRSWNWGSANHGFADVSERLRSAMTRNPSLKVFVANGYYDLATPFSATEYTMDHLGLEPEYRGNITTAYYEAGHMMYIQKESLIRFTSDIAAFYTKALPKETKKRR